MTQIWYQRVDKISQDFNSAWVVNCNPQKDRNLLINDKKYVEKIKKNENT
jgi:hypothetical protein